METVSIMGKHIFLRPFLEKDMEFTFQWRCIASDLHLWFQRPEILSLQEFIDDFNGFIRNFCHIIQMICTPASPIPIGMTYSYKADYLNGHVFVCTFMDSEHRDYLYGAEASLLFTDYLFSYFAFRKVYAEVFEHNTASRNNLVKGGWVQEGQLKEHIWRMGEYKDMFIYALYRDYFYERYSCLLKKLRLTSVAGDAASPPAGGGETRTNGFAIEGATPHPPRA